MPIAVVTDSDRLKVKEYMKQAAAANRIIDDGRAELKDILEVLKVDHDIKPAVARKVLAASDKGNMPEVKGVHTDIEDLYSITTQ